MAILNPTHLLDQSDRLIAPPPAGPPRQVDLRRSMSSAYYALFHHVLTAAADEIVGKSKRATPLYALVYRTINHKTLRELCIAVGKSTLPKKYAAFAPPGGFGANIAAFALACIELQDKRHSADYDPAGRFRTSDAKSVTGVARSAIRRFDLVEADSRKAFLMLLLFEPRTS